MSYSGWRWVRCYACNARMKDRQGQPVHRLFEHMKSCELLRNASQKKREYFFKQAVPEAFR